MIFRAKDTLYAMPTRGNGFRIKLHSAVCSFFVSPWSSAIQLRQPANSCLCCLQKGIWPNMYFMSRLRAEVQKSSRGGGGGQDMIWKEPQWSPVGSSFCQAIIVFMAREAKKTRFIFRPIIVPFTALIVLRSRHDFAFDSRAKHPCSSRYKGITGVWFVSPSSFYRAINWVGNDAKTTRQVLSCHPW